MLYFQNNVMNDLIYISNKCKQIFIFLKGMFHWQNV